MENEVDEILDRIREDHAALLKEHTELTNPSPEFESLIENICLENETLIESFAGSDRRSE